MDMVNLTCLECFIQEMLLEDHAVRLVIKLTERGTFSAAIYDEGLILLDRNGDKTLYAEHESIAECLRRLDDMLAE